MNSISVNDQLIMQQLRLEDAEQLALLVDRNRNYLRRYMPWLDMSRSSDDSRFFINKVYKQWQLDGSVTLGVFYRGRLIGVNGFHPLDVINRNGSIGYWIDAAHQGQGLTTVCTREVVRYGFEKLNLHRIEIRCACDNGASEAVAKKLGFQFEGIKRQCEWLYERFIDNKVYSLLQSEFTG